MPETWPRDVGLAPSATKAFPSEAVMESEVPPPNAPFVIEANTVPGTAAVTFCMANASLKRLWLLHWQDCR